MKQIDRLRALGLFDSRVPRYTSYPAAPVFNTAVDCAFQSNALSRLDHTVPVSVYIHIPFCERLCWFCACRTQGTQTLSPVENYVTTVEKELALLAKTLPKGLRMGRLHWGGGTPTILPPALIHRLARAVKSAIPPADDWEFSVEIDPTMVDRDKINALAQEGMKRASIGIQDFDPEVQAAIGRIQPFSITENCVADLRSAGIKSLNTDLVYGLPHQDTTRIADTVDKVLTLAPDRVALFGYAHVPWVAKRQKLIDDNTLPSDETRYHLAELAAETFHSARLASIGIDHFARSKDGLNQARKNGRLRRNFQGYTDDLCPTLIGVGASSISRFEGGYVQNTAATAAYIQQIEAGELAGARGHMLTPIDKMRARAIEMLMCDFCLDRTELHGRFGQLSNQLNTDLERVAATYSDLVTLDQNVLRINPEGRALTRIIASAFDAHKPQGVRYSQAS
ncbi:oxygen-independent coproporphyrinogen III oxidase [Phaeobacter sp. C3_T13_0]|uniref:oxygen-independent coproporphyrinogen III oxidase n=1 Tax=Phaeobacter cretensis TaxID=3342641 RepID=UPI0039BD4E0C